MQPVDEECAFSARALLPSGIACAAWRPLPIPPPEGEGTLFTLSLWERVAKGRVRGLRAIPRASSPDEKIASLEIFFDTKGIDI